MDLTTFFGEICHARAMHRKYREYLEKANRSTVKEYKDFYRRQAAVYQIQLGKSEDAVRKAWFDANGDAIIGLGDFIHDYIREEGTEQAFRESVELARSIRIPEEKILKSVDEVDRYFTE